ncbi:MAG: fibronectin type III domain-containing protein [Granulosicoccus sp.]|nr:fibronectin type III domain-containing protein [Granulosicoccus sp.]
MKQQGEGKLAHLCIYNEESLKEKLVGIIHILKTLLLLALCLGYSLAAYGQAIPRPLFGTDAAPGTATSDTTPFFRWTSASGASSYDIEVYDLGNRELVIEIEGRSSTSYTAPALARGRDYVWRVRGCNGSGCGEFSEYYFFNITGTSPDAPNPLFGSDTSPGPSISDTTPQLTWDSVVGASSYDIVIRRFTTNDIVTTINGRSGTSYTTPTLPGAETYKWSIRACDNTGCGAYSSPFYFRVVESTPGRPSPLSGSTTAPGISLSDTTPRLRWTSVSGAISYQIVVRDLITNQLVANVDGRTTTSYITPVLTPGRNYRWNVRACNSAGCGSYSSNRFFRISGRVLDAPESLFGSTNAPGTPTADSTPLLRWSAVTGATSYEVNVFDTATDQRLITVDDLTGTTYTTTALTGGTRFRWNVRACNSLGCSDHSPDAYFYIVSGAATPAISILLLGE